MKMTVVWRKSSASGMVNDEACVEVAGLLGGVGVRDSKDPCGGGLRLTGAQFTTLVGRIKRGRLDL